MLGRPSFVLYSLHHCVKFELINSNFKNEFLENIVFRIRLLCCVGKRVGGARASVEDLEENRKINIYYFTYLHICCIVNSLK